jgi:hypothetical protein
MNTNSSPPSRQTRSCVQFLQETRGGLLQQQVAHWVAEAVVHLLEAVDIEHQHGQAMALIDGRTQLLGTARGWAAR